MRGIFSISLDFELHWGGFEKWPLHILNSTAQRGDYKQYFLNTRSVIPLMLQLFEKYQVHVTWATVGMLFHRTREELHANEPAVKPSYRLRELSAYNYIRDKGIGTDELSDPFHYAASLVEAICNTPYQELGTHTFSHFYCNEEGQTVEQFREDLKAAQRAAASFNRILRSLVFPRNQFNDEYLRVCYEEGISAVRSNPLDWFWHIGSTQAESRWKRLNRGADAYLPLGKKSTYSVEAIKIREGLPLCLPASRLLRPYNPKELLLNDLKISRIKAEMTTAARQGEVYHLWWHPHNFGSYPEASLSGLESILDHYAVCRQKYNMCSLSMGELAERIRSKQSLLSVI